MCSAASLFVLVVRNENGVVRPTAPTIIATDNLANQRVSQQAKASSRSRYFLIRQACLHQRVADGEISVVHVSDTQNPSDFLTKFISKDKTEDSIAYAMGSR